MTQAEALTNQCCWGHNLNLANIKWLRQVCKQKPSHTLGWGRKTAGFLLIKNFYNSLLFAAFDEREMCYQELSSDMAAYTKRYKSERNNSH